MKGRKGTFETDLEQVEQLVERLEPGSTVRLNEIMARINPKNRNGNIRKATTMMLKKYGITYSED